MRLRSSLTGDQIADLEEEEVIKMHNEWRRESVRHLNSTRRFSRTLANSGTDWPCLLLQILSDAAEFNMESDRVRSERKGQRPALPDQEQAMAIALGERRRAIRRRRREVRVELPYCDFH
ncbi:hypothetical protein KSP39_PZI006606 [Platanthera zijinensis]|uniref:Uncharacterized protein n=1 Tax=Platanthera zijinensis TaxID=2320716 RepID=A0AAP0GAB6_9ASPA